MHRENELSVDSMMERIVESRQRLAGKIYRTPVLASAVLNDMAGTRLVFKCENFQRSGSFKTRGAFNGVFSLASPDVMRGIVTSSSGNQAAAVALAARIRGMPAYVAMPRNAAKAKTDAVRRYGGQITWVETEGEHPTREEYEATTRRIVTETGATVLHSHNDLRTIAGQGTCALEFVEECPDMDVLIVPVGGGGLISGSAVAARGLKPEICIIGCEPEMADDARQSFRAGYIVPQNNPRTIADGLRAELGDITYSLIARHVDDIVTVSEEAIVGAMRLVWEVLKIVIEPSSAVPLAAVLEKQLCVQARCAGIILSGGNVDMEKLPWMP